MIDQPAVFFHIFCFRDFVFDCFCYFPEQRNLKGCLSNQCHIVGTGIMFFVVQTMRIDKVGVDAAKLFCLVIHHLHKIVHRSADVLCDHICRIVCRCQHDRIQGRTDCDLLPDGQPDLAAVRIDRSKCTLRCFHFCIQVTVTDVLQGDQHRHDLGDARRIQFCFCVFAVKKCPCIQIHDSCTFCFYPGTLGPFFQFICLYRPIICLWSFFYIFLRLFCVRLIIHLFILGNIFCRKQNSRRNGCKYYGDDKKT